MALRRGTFVHACGDILGMGDELDERTTQLAAEVRTMPRSNQETWGSYVDSYRLFLKECVPHQFVRIIHPVDTRVVNEIEMYTGKPDQIWLMADGREAVVDLKTGGCPKHVAVQLAAYDLGVPHEKRRRRFALQLKPDGYKLHECTNSRDYDAFRLLVRAWWIVNSKEYAG